MVVLGVKVLLQFTKSSVLTNHIPKVLKHSVIPQRDLGELNGGGGGDGSDIYLRAINKWWDERI